VPAPDRPVLATVRFDHRPAERFAVAGRYPARFDAIGVDRDNLRQLAERTGGAVIEPIDTRPIDFRWPPAGGAARAVARDRGGDAAGRSLLWWRLS
jgi:hypothetical protein